MKRRILGGGGEEVWLDAPCAGDPSGKLLLGGTRYGPPPRLLAATTDQRWHAGGWHRTRVGLRWACGGP